MPRGLGNLSSPTGMEPGPPAVEVWSPNHWTVRNSQTIYLKWVNIMVCKFSINKVIKNECSTVTQRDKSLELLS